MYRSTFMIHETDPMPHYGRANKAALAHSSPNTDSISLYLLESRDYVMKLYNGSVGLYDKHRMGFAGRLGETYTSPSNKDFRGIYSIMRMDMGKIAQREALLVAAYDSIGVYDQHRDEYHVLWKTEEKHGIKPKDPQDYESPCEKFSRRNMEPLQQGIFPCTDASSNRLCLIADVRLSPLGFNMSALSIPFESDDKNSAYYWCSSMASVSGGALEQHFKSTDVAMTGVHLRKESTNAEQATELLILGYGTVSRDKFDAKWTWEAKLDTKSVSKLPSPVISPAGDVLCLTYTGFICFHTHNGSMSWQVKSDLYVEEFAMDSEHLYAVQHLEETGKDTLVAFNLTDGQILWKFDATDETHTEVWRSTLSATDVDMLQSSHIHFSTPAVFGSHLLVAFDAPASHLHGFIKIHTENATLDWQSTTRYPNRDTQMVRMSNVMLGAHGDSYFYEVTFAGAMSTLKPLSEIVVSKYFSVHNVEPRLLYSDATVNDTSVRVFHNMGPAILKEKVSCVMYVSYSSLPNVTLYQHFSTVALSKRADYITCATDTIPASLRDGNALLSVFLCLNCNTAGEGITSNALDFEYTLTPEFDPPVNATGAPLGMNITLSLTGHHFGTMMHLPVKCRFYDASAESGFIDTVVDGFLVDDKKVQCASFFPHFEDDEYTASILSAQVSIDNGRIFFDSPQRFVLYPPFELEEVSPTIIPLTAEDPLYFIGGTTFMDQFVAKDRIRCAFFDKSGSGGAIFVAHANCNKVKTVNPSPLRFECACLLNKLSTRAKRLGSHILHISLNGGETYNSTQHAIQFYNNPSLDNISPEMGSVEGGQKVTLTGSGFFFSEDLVCRFATLNESEPESGSVLVDAQYVSATQITCVTPQITINDTIDLPYLAVHVDVSENGRDFTHTNVTYTFTTKHCPGTPLCSGHGRCDPAHGICTCELGYTGEACESFSRIGYWTVAIIATFLVTIVFMAVLLALVTYFNRRSSQFNRMVKERKHNDISTAL